jgi:AraC-like DNA-binding protein
MVHTRTVQSAPHRAVPFETIDDEIFVSSAVRVGRFRRAVSHPQFRDSGPIQNDCFVFPRTTVAIRHSGQRVVADPNTVTLYNRGQEYEREAVSADGDRCDWYGVSPAILRDAIRTWDPRAADDRLRPLRVTHAHVSADTYLAQRRLFVEVSRGAPDVLHVEETVVRLLDVVLAAAYSVRGRPPGPSARSDLIPHAQWVLGQDLGRTLTLACVADAVGTSMFQLCRAFRAATGHTMHRYRTHLRVRSALEGLENGADDLTRLALDLGFASHSHFSATFRRVMGIAPSFVRAQLRQGSRRLPNCGKDHIDRTDPMDQRLMDP